VAEEKLRTSSKNARKNLGASLLQTRCEDNYLNKKIETPFRIYDSTRNVYNIRAKANPSTMYMVWSNLVI
jgi:hypothetical protein